LTIPMNPGGWSLENPKLRNKDHPTPDGFLSTKTRDGGIGLTSLAFAFPRIRAAKDWVFVHSLDSVTHTIFIGSSTGASVQSRFTRLGLKVDTSGSFDHRLAQHD